MSVVVVALALLNTSQWVAADGPGPVPVKVLYDPSGFAQLPFRTRFGPAARVTAEAPDADSRAVKPTIAARAAEPPEVRSTALLLMYEPAAPRRAGFPVTDVR
jgi:hypothetical protein